ncbi:MAG: CBS domain-containing protein [Saprospiraceae bacterium]|nr:CBS domain-containing protein [Saprospiraceae bacterium]
MILVKNVMTPHPEVVQEGDTLEVVAQLFKERGYHHLPVLNEENDLVGIISSTDFERTIHGATLFKVVDKQAYNETILKTMLVYNIMVKDPISVQQDQSIESAYTILKQGNFRCLPVLDENELVGIVTAQDLLDYFMVQHKAAVKL